MPSQLGELKKTAISYLLGLLGPLSLLGLLGQWGPWGLLAQLNSLHSSSSMNLTPVRSVDLRGRLAKGLLPRLNAESQRLLRRFQRGESFLVPFKSAALSLTKTLLPARRSKRLAHTIS